MPTNDQKWVFPLFDPTCWRHQLQMFIGSSIVILVLFTSMLVLENEESKSGNDWIVNSMTTEVLKNSVALRCAHISLIASTLPSAFDTFLDVIQAEAVPFDLGVRLCIMLCNLIPSSVFLSMPSSGHGTMLYIIFNQAATVAIYASVVSSLFAINFAPFWILKLLATLYSLSVLMSVFGVASNDEALQSMSGYPSLLVVGLLIWSLINFWRNKIKMLDVRKNKKVVLSDRETVGCLYVATAIAWWLCALISQQVTNTSFWLMTPEVCLICYVAVQYTLVIPVTVLPGRLARRNQNVAERLLNQKRAFVRYVSHEIRSPLNIVSAGLELLLRDVSETLISSTDTTLAGKVTAIVELLEDVATASESAISILNDLLHYENIDAGTFSLEKLPIHPSGLLQARNLAIIAKRQGLSMDFTPFVVSASTSHIIVNADIYRIEQVARNLVTNASKFTPRGGKITLKSSIELFQHMHEYDYSEPKGKFIFSVTDTGVGISEVNKLKVFGEFQQFDRNSLQSGGGSGLGLWISKQIIQLHDGKMGFTSEGEGKGTTFYFELPVYHSQISIVIDQQVANPAYLSTVSTNTSDSNLIPKPDHCEGGGGDDSSDRLQSNNRRPNHFAGASFSFSGSTKVFPLADPPSDSQEPSAKSKEVIELSAESQVVVPVPMHQMKVLVVDDSFMNRKMVKRILSGETTILFEIIEAEDGVEAIEIMVSHKGNFDLVIMDSVLKVKHGPETVEHFRRALGYTGYITGLTGNALPEDITDFMAKGLDECLIKPLRSAALMEVVMKAKERSKLTKIPKRGSFSLSKASSFLRD